MTIRTICPPISLSRNLWSLCGNRRCYSTPISSKDYGKTLKLPRTSFPLWTDPSKGEDPFRERTTEKLYRWQWANKPGQLFVLHDGPPYANGDLHMGHALNKLLKDFINRSQMVLGRKVHYIPGWDCHGLPIENKALQGFGEEAFTLPPTTIREAARQTALREIESQKKQFLSFGVMADWNSDEWTYRTLDHKYELRQLQLFQKMVKLGYIFRHYRPVYVSPSSRSALAEAELVYKDDHVSHSAYVSFTLKEFGHPRETSDTVIKLWDLMMGGERIELLVWTTTPWTLTANMGIAVNPNMNYVAFRGKGVVYIVAKDRLQAAAEVIGVENPVVEGEMMGCDLTTGTYEPIFHHYAPGYVMPIIPSSHVTPESGTGLVHCAPAHGIEDYNVFRDAGRLLNPESMVCHVNHLGRFTDKVFHVLGDQAGKDVLNKEVLGDGSKIIADLLARTGRLLKIQRIKHRYPYDWKTDKPVIITATSQWFANLDSIKEEASNSLKHVRFCPPQSENRLKSFIDSRSEWCISRQRAWGVPIPSLHCVETGQAYLNETTLRHILPILEKRGVDYWWSGPVEEFLPPALIASSSSRTPIYEQWKKGMDTMDVWFDSGSSWTMLSEFAEGRQYLADVCLEGTDQHRGWFQSQLLTKCGSAPRKRDGTLASPYRTLVTHGMVLDEKGKKMSKSLGNIISPLTIINGGEDQKKDPVYGADVLRLWAATVDHANDMSIGPKVLSQTADNLRKIRNTTRFLLGNLQDGNVKFTKRDKVAWQKLGLLDRYVMHELYTLQQMSLECNDLEQPNNPHLFDFSRVMNSLVYFANVTLSSLYFDIRKDCLYADAASHFDRRCTLTVFKEILETMTAIYAPILPHLAEEVHATLNPETETSYFMSHWKPLGSYWHDPVSKKQMEDLLVIRSHVLYLLENARKDKRIKSSLEAEVDIIIPRHSLVLLPRQQKRRTSKKFAEYDAFISLLKDNEIFLKSLFITSHAQIHSKGSARAIEGLEWEYSSHVTVPGLDESFGKIGIRVRPATRPKCLRCWSYTSWPHLDLCQRCIDVLTLLEPQLSEASIMTPRSETEGGQNV